MRASRAVRWTLSRPKSVVVMGAAGFDYHLFNRVYRARENVRVVAFTAAAEQNLGTSESALRSYPASLAGKKHYPTGVPTIPEAALSDFIKQNAVDEVVLAYSDIAHPEVMHRASQVLAAGASFKLFPPAATMIKTDFPVFAVTAVRTGCGKSQMSVKVAEALKARGFNVVAVREPMPYGDLEEQVAMEFKTYADLDRYKCTIEEREEYEQYVDRGLTIWSGVDYEEIARQIARQRIDAVVWDGGNNEIPFFVPDVHVCLADSLRPGHELGSYPGEVNARMADYLLITKENSARPGDVAVVEQNLRKLSKSPIVHCNAPVTVAPQHAAMLKGKRVVVVEDGPTLTHGGMSFGAGVVAATRYGATIVPPNVAKLPKSLQNCFREFSHLQSIIPAMGYTRAQLLDLETAINGIDADYVLVGTPFDLGKVIRCNKPLVRVSYTIEDNGAGPVTIAGIIDAFVDKAAKRTRSTASNAASTRQ